MGEMPLTFGSDFRLWRCVEHRGDRSRWGWRYPRRLRRCGGWMMAGSLGWGPCGGLRWQYQLDWVISRISCSGSVRQ